jgi:hypothetical protein
MSHAYEATVPVFAKMLANVDGWLDKALAFAVEKKFDVQILLDARLAPDQYRFTQQIQSACDYAKFGCAKLAGKEAPVHADDEKTLDEIRKRVHNVRDYVTSFNTRDFDGAEQRIYSHSWMSGAGIRGLAYVDHVVLPNLYFHLTSAYAILRHNGVPLLKVDFTKPLPYV